MNEHLYVILERRAADGEDARMRMEHSYREVYGWAQHAVGREEGMAQLADNIYSEKMLTMLGICLCSSEIHNFFHSHQPFLIPSY